MDGGAPPCPRVWLAGIGAIAGTEGSGRPLFCTAPTQGRPGTRPSLRTALRRCTSTPVVSPALATAYWADVCCNSLREEAGRGPLTSELRMAMHAHSTVSSVMYRCMGSVLCHEWSRADLAPISCLRPPAPSPRGGGRPSPTRPQDSARRHPPGAPFAGSSYGRLGLVRG